MKGRSRPLRYKSRSQPLRLLRPPKGHGRPVDAPTPVLDGDPGALFPSPGQSGLERGGWEGVRAGGPGKGARADRTPGYPRQSPCAPCAPGTAGRRLRASDPVFPARTRPGGLQVPLQPPGPLPPLLQSLPEARGLRGGRGVPVRPGRGAERSWACLH